MGSSKIKTLLVKNVSLTRIEISRVNRRNNKPHNPGADRQLQTKDAASATSHIATRVALSVDLKSSDSGFDP